MKPLKPGWRTTEFWMTLATAIASLLIGYGVLSKEQADLWLNLIAALTPALVVGMYSISRGIAKK